MNKIAKSGLNFSEFVLRACLNQKVVYVEDLKEVRRQLYGIGNNLNQLTTLANMGRIQTVNVREALDELHQCHAVLDAVRDKVNAR